MKTHRFFTIFALTLLMLFSTGQVGFSAQWDFDEITLGPGFGDVWNRYTYTQIYYEGDPLDDSDDAVYFGTYNQREPVTVDTGDPYDDVNGINYGAGIPQSMVSKGGRIWKYTISTGHWKLIWPNLDLSNFDTNEFGWRIAEVYDGKIYFGSYKSGWNTGARLMVIDPTDDSVGFIGPGPSGWGSLVSVRALEVYNDKLYIGSEYYLGGDLWSYDGTTLAHVWSRPGPGFYTNVAYLQAYSDANGDFLYIGGWYNPALYRMDANENISANIIPAQAAGDQGGPISMEVFDDKLFVGTANLSGGFSLFYYTSTATNATPTFIEHPSFDNMTYAWILRACGDLLFMGAYTSGGDPEEGLWVTSNGDDWSPRPNFYDPVPEEYGLRSMACGIPADGIERLFYGTAAVNTGSPEPRFSHGTRVFRIEGPFDSLPPLPPLP